MGPGLKYTLARLGLLVAVLLVLLPFNFDLLLKLLIAVAVSAILSYFLLRGLRDQYAVKLGETMDRRREEKEKLRSTLAGDAPAAGAAPVDEADNDRDSDGPTKKPAEK
ncbi:energy-converting hydrogenase Eha subunit E [Allocatelliglobosispora scoriae]|uniref:Energy-converting hydrogenase Eha subunit E n=1 Tax=Allocatelliglobosispora scoriae TaxID=643052 RepID=A0A841BRB1_9ACTN|nr:DUF4229 domain-containing protein [Allocatelliglobosispora scoriae]MBB5870774.1 energy-converting hydrogenase Eha subunit E [Allocatelliglobosispora scoriae]